MHFNPLALALALALPSLSTAINSHSSCDADTINTAFADAQLMLSLAQSKIVSTNPGAGLFNRGLSPAKVLLFESLWGSFRAKKFAVATVYGAIEAVDYSASTVFCGEAHLDVIDGAKAAEETGGLGKDGEAWFRDTALGVVFKDSGDYDGRTPCQRGSGNADAYSYGHGVNVDNPQAQTGVVMCKPLENYATTIAEEESGAVYAGDMGNVKSVSSILLHEMTHNLALGDARCTDHVVSGNRVAYNYGGCTRLLEEDEDAPMTNADTYRIFAQGEFPGGDEGRGRDEG
ncbi:hypothetical protein EDC01DRAFT_776042 [Geopyxis carbonaria]|nr:hypothetical protein EDC01DRAFT_776042 [Geopyxis carbonaria]